jgi:hypothetical protein
MFNEKFQQIATAAVGALVFTTAAVGAAVGPARTAEVTPVEVAASVVAQNASQARA